MNDECEKHIKKFHILYIELIENKDEILFVHVFDELFNENLQYFYKIPDIKKLIYNLANESLFYAYKILLLAYIKMDLLNNILMYKNKSISDYAVISTQSIIDFIFPDFCYINAFKEMPFTFICDDDINKNDKKIDETVWKHAVCQEVMNRLIYLEQYFGENTLQHFFNIKKYYINDDKDLNFKKLVKYYNKCVCKIKNKLEYLIFCYNTFTEINTCYFNLIYFENHYCIFSNFDIIVK